MGSAKPATVLIDGDLVVMYIASQDQSALMVFSRWDRHDLIVALEAVHNTMRRGLDGQVRYVVPQRGQAAHLKISYHSELAEEIRIFIASLLIGLIKLVAAKHR